MKTISNINSFKNRLLDGELSVKEAMGIFVALITVVTVCIYVFAPQSFVQ